MFMPDWSGNAGARARAHTCGHATPIDPDAAKRAHLTSQHLSAPFAVTWHHPAPELGPARRSAIARLKRKATNP